jgi:nucleotidyltransferase AbiEii toxin of type IV toxin-antitoxin system
VASFPELRLEALLRQLARAEVDFVVVGGVAVAFQGYGRATKDLDITYATDAENLDRLGKVLVSLNAKLRGVAEDVPFVPDGRTLARTRLLTLDTDDGGLDLLADPPGAPPYATMRSRADVVELDDVVVAVAALDDLLAMKRAAGRPQDLVDVEALEIARLRRTKSDN